MVEHAAKSQALLKLAELREGEERENVLNAKFAHDVAVIACLEKMGSRILSSLKGNNVRNALGSVGKGMAMGAGAAVPLGVAGAMVANKANEDLRDTALMTAVPLGVGAGVYGLSQMMGNRGQQGAKTAADGAATAADAEAAYQTFAKLVKSASVVAPEASAYHLEVTKHAAGHLSNIVAELILED